MMIQIEIRAVAIDEKGRRQDIVLTSFVTSCGRTLNEQGKLHFEGTIGDFGGGYDSMEFDFDAEGEFGKVDGDEGSRQVHEWVVEP